jgi:hypothetical protein
VKAVIVIELEVPPGDVVATEAALDRLVRTQLRPARLPGFRAATVAAGPHASHLTFVADTLAR